MDTAQRKHPHLIPSAATANVRAPAGNSSRLVRTGGLDTLARVLKRRIHLRRSALLPPVGLTGVGCTSGSFSTFPALLQQKLLCTAAFDYVQLAHSAIYQGL
jgi:hypothetical protein